MGFWRRFWGWYIRTRPYFFLFNYLYIVYGYLLLSLFIIPSFVFFFFRDGCLRTDGIGKGTSYKSQSPEWLRMVLVMKALLEGECAWSGPV